MQISLSEITLAVANKALRDQKYEEAIVLYKQLLRISPIMNKTVEFNINFAEKKLSNSPKSFERENDLETLKDISSEIQNPEAIEKKLEDVSALDDEERDIYIKLSRVPEIDWNSYFTNNNHDFVSDDPIIDYIKNWKKSKPLIQNFFDTDYYLELYPDIKECGINPLYHYALWGVSEGRQGLLDTKNFIKGHCDFNENKETVVFVSHESSATGAPLLGLNLAESLLGFYNIVHIVIKKSEINDEFLRSCHLMLCGIETSAYVSSLFLLKDILRNGPIKCVIINSIVGYQVQLAAHRLSLPTLFLIHEFSEYMRPIGTVANAISTSDIVVVPAKIVEASILKEFRQLMPMKKNPSNIRIIPQGKLPRIPDSFGGDLTPDDLKNKFNIEDENNTKIIVGCGWVQIRKGVDVFISFAKSFVKRYGDNCKFIWVGEGFDPDQDLSYSVYLERQIEYSGLGSRFEFLAHQKNLDSVFSIADVFILTSRFDPFPNVVIDALDQDLHIGCFHEASGSAEFLIKHNANCSVADYLDTEMLAEMVVSHLRSSDKKNGVNFNISKTKLNFQKYSQEINYLIDEASSFRSKCNEICEYLMSSGEFRPVYSDGWGDDNKFKCQRYVESGLKGIHFYNPKPGFSERVWLNENSAGNDCVVPLFEALKLGVSSTHKVLCFDNDITLSSKHKFRYAVHLHLYYVDMLDMFLRYFKILPGEFDVYVTITDNKFRCFVEQAFIDCGMENVYVLLVDNIGRDMGPFLFSVGNKLKNKGYPVVGHFHSKKSLDIKSGDGEKWLKFLLDNLIGDGETIARILGLFNDPKLGLVFLEEASVVDIGKNEKWLNDLCDMLNLDRVVDTPFFPVGNMFWARTDAIEKLFGLPSDMVLEAEPLPYDGSYMHALERITPHLVASSGYEFLQLSVETGYWKY